MASVSGWDVPSVRPGNNNTILTTMSGQMSNWRSGQGRPSNNTVWVGKCYRHLGRGIGQFNKGNKGLSINNGNTGKSMGGLELEQQQ